jgi:hypothetical protein
MKDLGESEGSKERSSKYELLDGITARVDRISPTTLNFPSTSTYAILEPAPIRKEITQINGG